MANDTVKAQMQQAATHIKNKDYDEAIAILSTIDHPTADKWRERAESALMADKRQRKAKSGNRVKRVLQVIGVIVLLAVIVVGVGAWYYTAGYGNLELNTVVMCIEADVECDGDYLLQNHIDELRECRKRHGNVDLFLGFRWLECLESQGVTQLAG